MYDRDIRRPVAQNQGRRNVGRHVLQHHQRAARALRHRASHVGTLVQINLLDADTLVTYRFDPRYVVHQRSDLALMQSQYAVLNVLGAHPVVGPHDRDDRNVDLRENIDGHPQRSADAHEGDQNQNRHDRIGPLQREFDDGHAGSFETMSTI